MGDQILELKMVDKFLEFVHAQTAMAQDDTQEAMSVEREKIRWLGHLEVLREFVDGALAAYAEPRGVVRLILVPAKAKSPLFGFNTAAGPVPESELVRCAPRCWLS